MDFLFLALLLLVHVDACKYFGHYYWEESSHHSLFWTFQSWGGGRGYQTLLASGKESQKWPELTHFQNPGMVPSMERCLGPGPASSHFQDANLVLKMFWTMSDFPPVQNSGTNKNFSSCIPGLWKQKTDGRNSESPFMLSVFKIVEIIWQQTNESSYRGFQNAAKVASMFLVCFEYARKVHSPRAGRLANKCT